MKSKNINLSDVSLDESSGKNLTKEGKTNPKETPQKETPKNKEKTPIKVKLKEFWAKPNSKALVAIIIIGIAALAGASYFLISVVFAKPIDPETLYTIKENYTIPGENSFASYPDFILNEPSEPRTKSNPINGMLLTESEYSELMNRRPVVVMVNNHAAARPQSSLSQADVVYEMLVESGITRYAAFFWQNDVETVGPMRSIRNYYLEVMNEYDPIILHDGCALSDDPKVNSCGNIYNYETKDLQTYGAWREYDGVRVAPHNEYTSPVKAWDRAEELGWDQFPSEFTAWKFKKDAPEEERGLTESVRITFHERIWNGGLYDAGWEYDSNTNSYLRSIGGQPDIDQENNQQISAKVVILQIADTNPTYDDKGHIIVETIDTGDAIILQDGQEIEATWSKTSLSDRTTYKSSTGEEIEFNRGLIWISYLSDADSSYEITKTEE